MRPLTLIDFYEADPDDKPISSVLSSILTRNRLHRHTRALKSDAMVIEVSNSENNDDETDIESRRTTGIPVIVHDTYFLVVRLCFYQERKHC